MKEFSRFFSLTSRFSFILTWAKDTNATFLGLMRSTAFYLISDCTKFYQRRCWTESAPVFCSRMSRVQNLSRNPNKFILSPAKFTANYSKIYPEVQLIYPEVQLNLPRRPAKFTPKSSYIYLAVQLELHRSPGNLPRSSDKFTSQAC